MKKLFLLLIFGMIFLAVGVLAQDYICEEGSDTCVTNGKIAANGDQPGVGGNITLYPIGQGCSEQWSCSCVSGVTQCTDANGCGTTSTIPASQGQSCSSNGGGVSGGSGGGGGGGGSDGSSSGSGKAKISECVELWQCENWSECKERKQMRNCRDLAQCKTFVLKPATERECASSEELKIIEEEKRTTLLGSVLGAIKNLGKSKTSVAVIFIVLIIAAALIISAIRGEPPAAPAEASVMEAKPETEGKKEGKK